MFSSKPDTQVYQTGAHTRTQNSRAYLLALIAYMGIFLFGCTSPRPIRLPFRPSSALTSSPLSALLL